MQRRVQLSAHCPNPHPNPLHRQLGLLALWVCVAVLAGCATAPNAAALAEVRGRHNPSDVARRTLTNFTPALRCMDDKLFAQGTRDVTLMMEEMRDATLRVPVATRDMMASAISDMTRRSRAVRLLVFGSDQQNLTSVLQQAQRNNAFQAVPRYGLRGTISQFDEGVERRGQSVELSVIQRLFGVSFGGKLGSDTKFSVMGFDAALVDTATFSLIPGVTSKNQTVLATRDAQAGSGEGRLSNPGLSLVFNFAASRSDGLAQAARNMIELAALELVGKLLRLPYWQCLDVPDTDPEVQREMQDWFLSLNEAELRSFLQERMRELRFYDGPLDGQASTAFLQALAAYRLALGLPAQGAPDLDFFRRAVTQAVPRARPQSVAAVPAGTADAVPAVALAVASPTPSAGPLTLTRLPAAGDGFGFVLSTSREGYAYCYAQDMASGVIRRVFPNRFSSDPRLARNQFILLQNNAQMTLPRGASYACLHATTDVYTELPTALRWGDFEPLRLPTFDALHAAFAAAAQGQVSLQTLPAP